MPHGASHGSTMKETNSQPQGREGGKTSIHTGPAVGRTAKNTDMKGVFREPKGRAGSPAKQSSNRYV